MAPEIFKAVMKHLGIAVGVVLLLALFTLSVLPARAYGAEFVNGMYMTEPKPTLEPNEMADLVNQKISEECIKQTARVLPPEKLHYAATVYATCMAKTYFILAKKTKEKAEAADVEIELGGI